MAARTSAAAKRRLQLVETQQPAVATPEPRDIYAADRARIAAIDWDEVHIRGDRRRPVDLPDRPRRSIGLGGW